MKQKFRAKFNTYSNMYLLLDPINREEVYMAKSFLGVINQVRQRFLSVGDLVITRLGTK